MEFPQFRKYPNNKNYFKIISENTFSELQIIGQFYSFQTFEAKILPDRNFIADLLHNYHLYWSKIEATEFIEALEYCRKNLQEKS